MEVRILSSLVVILIQRTADAFDGPQNQVIVVNNSVTLTCTTAGRSDNWVMWVFSGVGSKTELTIYKDSKLSSNYTDRWSVDADGQLSATYLKPEDAGIYFCIKKSKHYSANIVILASDPICNSLRTSNSLEDQTMNENVGLSLSCRIQFWGNWPPTMQWSISGGTLKDDETITQYKTNWLKSALLVNSTRFQQTILQFTCKTHFTTDNKPNDTTAQNIPQYSRTWSAPIVRINPADAKNAPGIQVLHFYFLLAGFLGFLVILAITGLVVWKLRAGNAEKLETRRQPNPNQTCALPRSDYCDINEDEMRVELVGARLGVNTAERNKQTLRNRHPVECEAGLSTEETNIENVEYANVMQENCEPTIYENESTMECSLVETETDNNTIGATSSNKRRKNKNYVSLDASNREAPCPPSVYKRLKRMKPGPKDLSAQSIKSPVDPVDEQDFIIDGLKPKLPTPESSSLSGSSD